MDITHITLDTPSLYIAHKYTPRIEVLYTFAEIPSQLALP